MRTIKLSMARILTAALATLIGAALLSPQQRSIKRLDGSRITPAEIDRTVAHWMAAGRVTGAGIAIFNGGKIAYLKSYGERDTENHLPLTPDSIMTCASLSKPAFAVLVMELVHRGVIDLDKPVYEYLPKPLPEYPDYSDLAGDERYKLLTLRMLLDHTTGFPNLRRFMPDKKLKFYYPPGSRFTYSAEGILLGQMVVETLTGKPLNELMREFIYDPLGMTRTSMVWESRFEDNFANAYDEDGRALGPERRQEANAAGGMQSTLRDYARLVQAVLSGKIPPKKERNMMLSPQIRIHLKHEFPSLAEETTTENDAIRLSYGLGWGLYWSPYGEAFFKEGHDEGWRHYVVCFDKPKTGVLIMTNSSNGEDLYSGLLENLIRDTFTPLEWEGFKPSQEVDSNRP
jgi:CubicO group peptidase (beta-lactamase class C family)